MSRPSLPSHFSALDDPRQRRKVVYPVAEIMPLVLYVTLTGAGYGGTTPGRLVQRSGCRERDWHRRAATVGLRIAKLCRGSCFPGFPGAAPDGRG